MRLQECCKPNHSLLTFYLCNIFVFSLLPLINSEAFQNPPEVRSVDGILETTINIQYATISLNQNTINTRLLNGILPGTTLRLDAGDLLKVNFNNNLVQQTTRVVQHNAFQTPDTSNLHFHGPFISGELPSDDVTMAVPAGQSYQYQTVFPVEHMPGTFWIHPHYHGSTSLQVSGGTAAALIVNDPAGYLPTEIESARELVMVIQHFDLEETAEIAGESGDNRFSYTGNGPTEFLTNSGIVNPDITVASNEWIRTRVIYAGWEAGALDMQISLSSGSGNCEMVLLAKDGIYISDFPRTVNIGRIPPGGRADFMVKCSADDGSIFQIQGLDGLDMGRIVISGSMTDTTLSSWTPTMPFYLADTRSETVTNACNCPTRVANCNCNGNCPEALFTGANFAENNARSVEIVSRRKKRQAGGPGGPGGPPGGGGGGGGGDDFCINGRPMEMDMEPIHLQAFNQIQERSLGGTGAHPYHQHTWPFQLISGVAGNDDQNSYFRTGDWHDVYLNTQGGPGTTTVMRFVPRKYSAIKKEG